MMAELEQEDKSEIDQKLSQVEKYTQELIDRVAKMKIVHEGLVVVERIDIQQYRTILFLPEVARQSRIQSSVYGRVLGVSNNPSHDVIQEEKKTQLSIGDIVQFNPDAAYSLNVTTPKNYPEIWCVHIDNILLRDFGFDFMKAKRETLEYYSIMEKTKRTVAAEEMKNRNGQLIPQDMRFVLKHGR